MQTRTPTHSAPYRSLFRYPGGKSWLLHDVRRWLAAQPARPAELIEPFAGGATVSLTAVAEDLVERATLVELDESVCAVWQTLLHGDASAFAQRILDFELTPTTLGRVLAEQPLNREDLAFKTLVRNRVNRAGILAPGAAAMRAGLTSRWYASTLARRALGIADLADRVQVVCGDGLRLLEDNAAREGCVFFVDPPYSAPGKSAGKRLYRHWQLDHERLFELASRLAGDVLMTYDDNVAVRSWAAVYGLDIAPVSMRTAHHRRTQELLIGRDLAWFRDATPGAPGSIRRSGGPRVTGARRRASAKGIPKPVFGPLSRARP